jgi:hypothetical protein
VTIHHTARYQEKAPEEGTVKAAIAAFAEYVANEPDSRMPTACRSPVARSATAPWRTGPGSLSEVLTEHYRRAHPEALGLPSR